MPIESAWQDLRDNPESYLIQADKGGKAVLWQRSAYLREAERQLADPAIYREMNRTETDLTLTAVGNRIRSISRVLTRRGHISSSEAKRLTTKEWNIPPIYFLPKVHKEKTRSLTPSRGDPLQERSTASSNPWTYS